MNRSSFIESHEDPNKGLLLRPNMPGWVAAMGKNRTKKFQNAPQKCPSQNAAMLELVRSAGDRPISDERGDAVIVIPTPFSPPKWRHVTPRLKPVYYGAAVEELAAERTQVALALSINLTPHFTRTALLRGGLSYIRRRLNQALARALKRQVDHWLVLEVANEYVDPVEEAFARRKDTKPKAERQFRHARPHLHGAIIISQGEETIVKEAISTMNGAAGGYFRRGETYLSPFNSSKGGARGWGLYTTKAFHITRLFLPYTDAELVTCANTIATRAAAIYERDRQAVLNAR